MNFSNCSQRKLEKDDAEMGILVWNQDVENTVNDASGMVAIGRKKATRSVDLFAFLDTYS